MSDSSAVGDNKEFVSGTVIADMTIYFSDSTKTNANDTETEKYIDNPCAVKKFALRSDQTTHIVSINGITLTDPYTSVINKGIFEEFDIPLIFKMVIRPTVVSTAIKLRVK